jgi:hypothetical protein
LVDESFGRHSVVPSGVIKHIKRGVLENPHHR